MKHSQGFAEIGDTRLYFETLGQGHPLVLIHGGLMDHRMWEDQFQDFGEHFHVIRYDIRGYYRSADVDGPFSHVEDLYQLLEYLNVEKAHILGLSLGGQIAVDFTLEHPEKVSGLIAVAAALTGFPYADTENYAEKFNTILELLNSGEINRAVELILDLSYFLPVEGNPTLRQRMKEMIQSNYTTWAGPHDILIWSDPPAYGRLDEITGPVLVIVGDHDALDILDVADYLVANINGAVKKTISHGGHHVNMEQPESFNKVVLEFLKGM